MSKRILSYLLVVILTFVVVFFVHKYVLESQLLSLSFSLLGVYLFHAIASVLVYVIIEVIAENVPNQAGYAFLASVFLKIGFFVLLFKKTIFSEVDLEMFQRLSIITPFFLFILIEAVGVSKLLNSKTY